MKTYYDTGILLKLYLNEAASDQVRKFVVDLGRPLLIHSFHLTEINSAVQLKVFRRECTRAQARSIIGHLD